jgi:septum formation protein
VDLRSAYPSDFRLFLASQSPRRHSLLRDLGVPYEVVRTDADEALTGDTAEALASANAAAKVGRAVLPDRASGAFVLGTDTLVTFGDRVMGNPTSRADAAAMIAGLAGRTHQVVSGVALQRVGGALHVAAATTDVTFLALDKRQIEAYLDSGEWTDKAGAYGVQGLAATFVTEVRGEYSNVVGLPLCLLARVFQQAGFDLMLRQWL